MVYLADYLAQVREHHPLASMVSPKVSLSELLTGLMLTWPGAVPELEYDALVSYLTARVSGYGSAVWLARPRRRLHLALAAPRTR